MNKYIATPQLPLLLPSYLYQARWNLWLKTPKSRKMIECWAATLWQKMWTSGEMRAFLLLFFFVTTTYIFVEQNIKYYIIKIIQYWDDSGSCFEMSHLKVRMILFCRVRILIWFSSLCTAKLKIKIERLDTLRTETELIE